MSCNSLSIPGTPVATASKDMFKEHIGLRRSFSGIDLCDRGKMKRSYSDNHICYSVNHIHASSTKPKLKNSRSIGIFNFHLSGSIIPSSLRSFLFDPETSKDMDIVENSLGSDKGEMEIEMDSEKEKKRANWVQRLMEVRSHWREKQQKDINNIDGDDDGERKESCDEDGNEGGCDVDYSDEEGEGEMVIDRESFSSLLARVSWSDAKHFSQLAFLCNIAYVIAEIEEKDLRRYYGLNFVTSSLEKKAEAEAIKAKLDEDSTPVPMATSEVTEMSNSGKIVNSEQKSSVRPVAYEIAASAASYVQSRGHEGDDVNSHRNEIRLNGDEESSSPSQRVYKSEVAAYVAASTMTAVVAAGEKERQEAANDLQSLHSSPCDWFVCDDSSIYTRCFVIQGSDSLASWQANLFFEPTKFEGTDVLVHRGIYEAAKGIYEQFMPEIMEHLNRYGERAKLQFTGHSLGGSLSLLVNLMLLARKVVKPSALLPVVTFGSPFVFCGGHKILDKLGLDENHVHCVMMHRDIVPRAFSCNYPNHVAHVLKRLNGSFRSHPCLNKNKLLYSPIGKIFILQPDENSSPPHPLLPQGSALYALESSQHGSTKHALRAFLNNPHPLETLSDPTAYGSKGTILRDHDSSNYLKAVNGVIRQHQKTVNGVIWQHQETETSIQRVKSHKSLLWPLLSSPSPHAWSHESTLKNNRLVSKEAITTV